MQAQNEAAPSSRVRVYSWRDIPRNRNPREVLRASGFAAQCGAVAASKTAAGGGGNFVSLFTTPYYFVQADRGLTYGTTPRATSSNTSTTVITRGGTTPTTPVPVTFKSTNTLSIGSGATFSISFDGGSTFAMTGVTPTAGTPINLTGAGANITATWSAGTSVTNDTWKATGASLVDQSGNGLTWGQASASLQPIVTVGANGHVGLLFDGVDDFFSSSFNAVAGMLSWLVIKQAAWAGYATILGAGGSSNHQILFQDGGTASPQLAVYNGATLNGGSAGLAIATVGRVTATFNTATSSIKVGSNAVVNGTTGANSLAVNRCFGCDRWDATAINFANVEVFAWGEMAPQSYSAADTQAASYWGAAI